MSNPYVKKCISTCYYSLMEAGNDTHNIVKLYIKEKQIDSIILIIFGF